ncbi:hypothetical protein R3P38DRAFT_2787455 [Favolaschia claudopus]|uniref:Uncharacterized protein n=1 Tax=Favolaschia claudopus TaxID=2862362 RepID=A0AAW0ANT3_9AGAR
MLYAPPSSTGNPRLLSHQLHLQWTHRGRAPWSPFFLLLRTQNRPPAHVAQPHQPQPHHHTLPKSRTSNPQEFEILIHVIVEEKKVAGKKARGKQPKSAPAKFGPVTANVGFSFYQLTAKLAAALETDPPANSMFIPIRDANGMRSLIKHLLSPPKGASANFIIPQMSAPVPKPAAPSASWSGAGAGTSAQAVLALDDSEDIDEGPTVPFDVGLEDEMDKIAEAYPPGRCAQHPDISCFHYRQNNLHWELDRNKKIAWAAKKGTANLLKPPLGSNFFTAQSALKTRGSLPTTPRLPATPSTSVSVNMATPTPALPMNPMQAAFPMYNPYGFPSPMNGFPPSPPMSYPSPFANYPPIGSYGPQSPFPSWAETPNRRRRRSRAGDSSPPEQSSSKRRQVNPPSSPPVIGGSVDDFITAHPQFPPGLKPLLQKLGFEIGDDISVITDSQWSSADIAQFTAARIVKYYNKYKAQLQT